MAIVEEADLFLGVDSCMLHVADLNRIPGVGLFGPTSAKTFGFRFSEHKHIDGNGRMSHISEEAVIRALNDISIYAEKG